MYLPKINLDINIVLLLITILLLSCLDVFFIIKLRQKVIDKILLFNFYRVFIVVLGYVVFFLFYFYAHNEVISVIHPDEYFDSGMYVYVAKNIANGIALADTDFVLYYGTAMSPGWIAIVHLYAYVFLTFGVEEQILPLINLYLYSYLYFFFMYVLSYAKFSGGNKYKFIFLLLIMPGPLYWTVSLSKEVLNYLFMSLIVVMILQLKSNNKFYSSKLLISSIVFSVFSRMNILIYTVLGRMTLSSNFNSKLKFMLYCVKIYFYMFFTFAALVIALSAFNFNFFESPMYQHLALQHIEELQQKMTYVPMSLVEMSYKLPVKFILTVFDEVNPATILNYAYGSETSYASLFNTLQGLIRVFLIFSLVFIFVVQKKINHMALMFATLAFIFYLLFAIIIGFFQVRYILFWDYLLFFAFIFIFNQGVGHEKQLS
jgi:hypothetical protein